MQENILFATNKTFPPGSKLHQQPTDKKRNEKTKKNLSLESEKTYAKKKTNKINKNKTLTKSYHKQNPPNQVCVCVHVYFATESNLRFSRVDHLTQWAGWLTAAAADDSPSYAWPNHAAPPPTSLCLSPRSSPPPTHASRKPNECCRDETVPSKKVKNLWSNCACAACVWVWVRVHARLSQCLFFPGAVRGSDIIDIFKSFLVLRFV
uniref:(northern house mosquito) hypothetical protein n=1 Tax=Culex pipiens TaxID=7175 RepID=A0A8D8CZQ3_CULPI